MEVGDSIYLDYQAATPLDGRVLQAMEAAYATHFANPHSADHVLGWRAAAAIETASAQVGSLFGLGADDVTFTSGASEANAMALKAAQAIASQTGRTEVLIGAADHGSIRNEAESRDLRVKYIPLDSRGAPDPSQLQAMLSGKVALVSVVGVNNENGAIAELGEIAALCRSHGAVFHADLAQAPLAMDIDLIGLDIPFATISAHKLYGPKGVGALLAGPGSSALIKPVIVGAGQQGGRRGGTMPTELIMGFGEACRIISTEGSAERDRVALLRDKFVHIIEEKQIAKLVGGRDGRHPGNAFMQFRGQNAADLLARLQPQIAASTQSACSSGTMEPSHVLSAMGLDREAASECIRFSFGRFSNDQQIDRAIAIIGGAIEQVL
ncbi:cysteine desulfurase family protein [Croceicoccus sp. Ery5]|uniref:cysteine desulfurase family protein n=1 Tax=Croceicoccus sp. Ery5 TaxID=1703340 RepID=UPI001E32179C|nr:aminotransferase class V-fold PLP-dependent enzyme [Croceicoccus sp. Ery5]